MYAHSCIKTEALPHLFTWNACQPKSPAVSFLEFNLINKPLFKKYPIIYFFLFSETHFYPLSLFELSIFI